MKKYEITNVFTGERTIWDGLDAKHKYSVEHWYPNEKFKKGPPVPMLRMEREDFLFMLDNNLDVTRTAQKRYRIIDTQTINNTLEQAIHPMNVSYEMINEFDQSKKSVKSINELPTYQKEIFEELKNTNKLETVRFGTIYRIVKPLAEEVSRLQEIAGIVKKNVAGPDIDFGEYDSTKLPSETLDKPDDVSSYPKVDKIKFNQALANEVNPQDYEFHNDQMDFDKFAQGVKTAQDEKCDIPADVIQCIDQRVKELKASLDDYEGLGYSNQSEMKTNAIEFLEKVKSLLDHKDLEGIKLAQIEFGRLGNKVTDLLPPRVTNYIITAINPLAKDKRDNVDASERDRTNIP